MMIIIIRKKSLVRMHIFAASGSNTKLKYKATDTNHQKHSNIREKS